MNSKETIGKRRARLNRERQERWRNRPGHQIEDQTQARRAANLLSQQQRRGRELAEHIQTRRAADALAHRERLQCESLEHSETRRTADASAHRERLQCESLEHSETRRTADASAHRERLQSESLEHSEVRRAADALTHRERLQSESLEHSEMRRASDALAHRERLQSESLEHSEVRKAADALAHRERLQSESQEDAQARRYEDAIAHREVRERVSHSIREGSQITDMSQIVPHNCGLMDIICQFCGSRNFHQERPSDGKFRNCCHKGKIKLEKPLGANGQVLEYPDFLRNLMSDPSLQDYSNFRNNIRSYNSAVSFASMGAKVENPPGIGPYVFRVHGQIYHRTSHLQPLTGEAPRYAQLYVIDSTQATTERMTLPENSGCKQPIIRQIDIFLRANNKIADSYRMLRVIENEECERAQQEGLEKPLVTMVFRRDRRADPRRYNYPNANEIAMVFVGEDGEPPFERDIRIYPVNPENPNQPYININILSPNLDPMTYPLLYPFGEPGWQPNMRMEGYQPQLQRTRVNVSMLQFKVAQTAIRDGFNPIIGAGKLSQQWIVDSYLQVEANNLNFVRQKQKKLRTELYHGLADHMANVSANTAVQAGVPVILPSSFEGSPRNMRERCNDAMSIFGKFGAPDLFITVTSNPNWVEIDGNLNPGEHASDRPDLVARVFKLKLNSIIDDLTKHGILGKSTAYVYTIEFQKRGLPHAHILIVLQENDKFKTAEDIDRVVHAELPHAQTESSLFAIVTRCMIHGPCGDLNPQAVCMKNGACNKKFPKEFQDRTSPNVNGYPLYRRRQGYTSVVRGKTIDNRYVVPYNKYLLMKYNCHINVEVCTSVKTVKYIYKYIHKGYDCANLEIRSGERQLRNDEVANFIDARYVSACEAMWRLLESPMHNRSHAVIRLPVHLPQQQRIVFEEGQEEQAILEAETGRTKLTAWFDLNSIDDNATQYLYTDIPYNYIYNKGKWQPRQRGANKIIARMYTVGANDQERFSLRLLLLHVSGATSYEFLQTVNGVVYQTFKEAALNRNLLNSDEEWQKCMEEAVIFHMPKQLRLTFSYICVYCMPTNALRLWESFCENMALDYLINHDRETSLNLALHDIDFVIKQHGFHCSTFNLPEPTGIRNEVPIYDQHEEEIEGEERILKLNYQQMAAFTLIIRAIDIDDHLERCFFLDGPGGSGKTYLYNTLISFIRGRGQTVLSYATTGIASTLMKGGRTVHSGFKLPIPIVETSVSQMKQTSEEAKIIRQAALIIIDEVTMLQKHGLRCIEQLLRDLMQNERPFGGKVIVIGGDFRQTLPVVPRGSRADVIEACIKSSPFWNRFVKLSLISNMRSEGQEEFNKWLLDVGIGALPPIQDLTEDLIEIPRAMISEKDIVTATYGDDLTKISFEHLTKRVILTTKNKEALELNMEIISHLPGESHTYYSSDTIRCEDPSDAIKYPSEFLHAQTPSGMPPHKLVLKNGTIVMLLRNLNPKQGLCNGTRLITKECQQHFIIANILSESNRGDTVFIPRIDLAPSDVNLPFVLHRRQFPLIPAFSITINKSQGQTFDQVGLFLNEPVFSHGQLYVALSRASNAGSIKVLIKDTQLQGKLLKNQRRFTPNVIFNEVFD